MKRNIVNLLCLFIPSRNMRYRIRKKLVTKTKFEELEESVDMLYYTLENCVGISNIPKAVGKLRKIQEDNIKLIDFFDSLCKKYNLKYWLDFGSLLGAVRHKGFIPWDDDLDVGMTYDDYKKLFDILPQELEYSDYEFIIKSEKPRKLLLQIKNKTNLAQLDIFPYNFYYKKIKNKDDERIFYKNLYRAFDECLNKFGYKIVDGKTKYLAQNIEKIVKHIILEDNNVKITDEPDLFWGIEFYHNWENKIINYNTIFPLKTINFEGLKLSIPNNSEKHLTNIYGNYMEIPRKTHIHNLKN